MPLVFFDMDGTLTREPCFMHLARKMNQESSVNQLEHFLARGEITSDNFAEEMTELFSGTPLDYLKMICRDLPVIPGIQETVDQIKAKGYSPGIVTQSAEWFAKHLVERYGFDFVYATPTITDQDRILLFGPKAVTQDGKAVYVIEKCEEEDVNPRECVRVTDSQSDKKM